MVVVKEGTLNENKNCRFVMDDASRKLTDLQKPSAQFTLLAEK